MTDLDDEKLLREREAAERRAAKEHQAMLRWMLSQKPARKFLGWLLFDPLAANLHASVFDRDPMAMAMKTGVQQVGLALQQQLIDAAPDEYFRMLAEIHPMREDIPSEVTHE